MDIIGGRADAGFKYYPYAYAYHVLHIMYVYAYHVFISYSPYIHIIHIIYFARMICPYDLLL